MKELYLIPKLTYERLSDGSIVEASISKNHEEEEEDEEEEDEEQELPYSMSDKKVKIPLKPVKFGKKRNNIAKSMLKTVIPPLIQREEIPLRVTERRSMMINKKPPLTDIIPLHFTETKIPYVNSVLQYLQKSSNIQWDDHGELYSPLNGYNILHIIKSFLDKNKVEKEIIEDYDYLIKLAGIPHWLIRNKSLVKQLQKTFGIKKGAGGLSKRKLGNSQWIPY